MHVITAHFFKDTDWPLDSYSGGLGQVSYFVIHKLFIQLLKGSSRSSVLCLTLLGLYLASLPSFLSPLLKCLVEPC